ncbi:acyl-CoA thioesterase [Nonomuraea thailandensis]
MTEAVTQLTAPARPIEVRHTPRRHVYHRQVRFSDIDAHGHVNNVRFLEYLEDARIALFLDYAGTPPEDRSGLPAVGSRSCGTRWTTAGRSGSGTARCGSSRG